MKDCCFKWPTRPRNVKSLAFCRYRNILGVLNSNMGHVTDHALLRNGLHERTLK